MTTWAAGQRITADRLNDTLVVIKSGDTSRTTATISNDPHLTVSVAASAVYLVTLSATWTAHVTGDLQWNFSLPSGASFPYRHIANDGTSTAAMAAVATGAAVQARSGATGVDYGLDIKGTLTTSSAGTFAFAWAENTVFATGTIFRAGSSMSLYRVS